MPIPVATLLLKFAPTLAKYAATSALDYLPKSEPTHLLRDHGPEFVQNFAKRIVVQGPVEKAIVAACESIGLPPNSIDVLRSWVKADVFQNLLLSLQNGELSPAGEGLENVAESLIPFLTIIDNKRAKQAAHQILGVFLQKLDEFVVFDDAGLARHDAREETRHAVMHDQLNAIQVGVANLSQRLIPPESKEALPQYEIQYTARLDEARRLLESGQLKAARSILESLRADLDAQSASSLILYRVEANLGFCSLFLDHAIDGAAEHFEAARCYQPEHPTGLANCARIALLRDEAGQALFFSTEALLRDPKHSYARAMHVQALYALEKKDELQKQFESEDVQLDPVVLLAFAQNVFQSEDYQQSQKLATRVVELDPKDAYALELLGRAIAVPVQNKLNAEQPLPWMISSEDIAILDEGRAAFSRSIDILKETEWTDALATALANRPSVTALTGDFDRCLADCEDALNFDDSLELAHATQAAVLLQLNRHAEAAVAYEQLIANFNPEPRYKLALAVCYLNSQQQSKAVPILESLKDSHDAVATRVHVYEVLIEAYVASGEQELAQQLLDQANGHVPELEYLELSSRFYEVTGDFARAIGGLRKMREAAQGVRRQRITLELAEALYKADLFDEAANEFAAVTNAQIQNATSTKYYICLFNAGRHKEALEKARAVRMREGPQPVITLIEARVLDLIGDVVESAALYQELIPVVDRDPEVFIRLTIALERRGRYSDAAEAIAHVELSDKRLDAISSMAVAKLRHRLGLDRVLDFAFDALQKGRDQPQIQLAYLWTILSREHIDKPILEPEIAAIGTVLELEGDLGKRVITIVDDQASHNPPDVVRVSSALGQQLCGKRAGEIVQFSAIPVPYRIVALKRRYVYEHERIYLNFAITFPGDDSLRMVAPNDDSTRSLVLEMEQRSTWVDKLLTMYSRGEIPAARLARALGETSVDTLLSLAIASDQNVLVSDGDPNERINTVYVLSQHRRVIMDLPSLLTMAYLDLLDPCRGFLSRSSWLKGCWTTFLKQSKRRNSGQCGLHMLARQTGRHPR